MAIVPVAASAVMVVPNIAVASSTVGVAAAGDEGAGAALRSVSDPIGAVEAVGADPSQVNDSAVAPALDAASCPAGPAGASAVAAPECAVSEPPLSAGATADAVPAGGVSVAGGLVFDPGNIVSDAVFYNSAAMTDEQIAAFLAAQGAGCAGEWCLKNLLVDVPAQPGDEFCAAIPGGVGLSAAAVIGAVSRACGVNPQVMVVTLQKESGLLDRSGPSAASYDSAWGWHCPDTGPGGSANCDPAYAGFMNQAFGMAKQWSRYRVAPDRYRYRAGETANILWNVAESGCGSAPVTIANTATASLYNYTPYQPNAAALAAYPGVGDACSAYGNRNFFFLFNRYFGSTGGGRTGIAVGAGARAASAVSGAAVAGGLSAPVEVPVPVNGFVAAGAAGRSIMAPTPAVAAGLVAGFAALGLPYVWGGGGSGAGPNNGCVRGGGQFNSCGPEVGFDCSGLTAFVLGRAGFAVPGNSSGQRGSGIPVAWDRALPGDIVGFPGHVAVYLGTFDGVRYILEASWVGTPVHVVPLTRADVDATVYRYWASTPDAGAAGGLFTSGAGARVPRAYVADIPLLRPVPSAGTATNPALSTTPPLIAASSSSAPGSPTPAPAPAGTSMPESGTSTAATQTTNPTTVSSGSATTGTPSTGTTSSGATSAGTSTVATSTGATSTGASSTGTSSTGAATSGTTATGTTSIATTNPTAATPGSTLPVSTDPTTPVATASPSGTTAMSTGQSTGDSTEPVATPDPTTSTLPLPTTVTVLPVVCPPTTSPAPPLTTVSTPTLPTTAASAEAAAGAPATTPVGVTMTTFAALLYALTDAPCS